MKRKKVLVTGADGVFAKYVIDHFKKNNYNVIPTNKSLVDVSKKEDVLKIVNSENPDIIIHLAALTNVDECEKNPTKARRVNALGTRNITAVCGPMRTLIYISTSAVFDGNKKGYSELDQPAPLNIYGKTKLEGEEFVKSTLKEYYIVRAGWLIGGGEKEKKFISYIIDDIKKGKRISVVNDKFGTITYARELAVFLEELIHHKQPFGVYHYGSKGVCSRHDIAKQIAKILKKDILINAISSDKFKKVFFAPRPKYEVLKSIMIKFPNTWRRSLTDYIHHEFS